MRRRSARLQRPYREAEHHFLQALLTSFSLKRGRHGTHLALHLESNTPTIWSRFAKRPIRDAIPDFASRASHYQGILDAVLVDGEREEYHHADPVFPFRYGSGGVLPIVRMGRKEYFCLFYRDIHPIGWNIANGGCDSRDELMYPLGAAERELREELIVFDGKKRRWYVFAADAGKPPDHPDFTVARRLWAARFRNAPLPDEEWPIPLKWLKGPDSLDVYFHHPQLTERAETTDCYLNINALDFGIEVDRVARLRIDEDAILLDGEVVEGRVINRPVGLFETKRVLRGIAARETRFLPDIVFYDGCRHVLAAATRQKRLQKTIDEFLTALGAPPSVRSSGDLREYAAATHKFNLCPVTERIIRRLPPAEQAPGRWDVFISYASEDAAFAGRVQHHLAETTGSSIFFAPRSVRESDWGTLIDRALDDAKCLVAVASKIRHLEKRWVEYEWRSYFQESLASRPASARPRRELLAFLSHRIKAADLPRPFRVRTRFTCHSMRHPERDMPKLVETVAKAVERRR